MTRRPSIRLGSALAAVIVCAAVAMAETVELIDGRRIKGKVVRTTQKKVHVRTAPNFLVRIDKLLIRRIYKDGEKLPPPPVIRRNPTLPPRGGWPKSFPKITLEAERRISARVTEILNAASPAERAKLLAATDAADRRLIPPIETLERWLATPRTYPKSDGRAVRIDLPWQGENPRAISFVGVPVGYDPRKKAWPILITLHGTEDKPDASVSHQKPVLRNGVFLVAPRTLQKWQFWYHGDNVKNIFRILGHMANHYRIDPRRIVISGGSGGGFGTWGVASLHPELFCAAGSSAGMPPIRPRDVVRFRNVPFFIMHGEADFIPVSGPRKMHAAMEAARIEHVYFEHDGGHYPTAAQYKRFREWLQKAPPKKLASPRPTLLHFMRDAANAKPLSKPKTSLNRTPATSR